MALEARNVTAAVLVLTVWVSAAPGPLRIPRRADRATGAAAGGGGRDRTRKGETV